MTGSVPRPAHLLLAARALEQIDAGHRPADAVLNDLYRAARSGARDRAQISALVFGVLRNWFPLRAALGAQAPAIELCVAQALRTGAAPALREVDVEQIRARLVLAAAPSAAERHNLPEWFWRRLCDQFGESEAAELADALNREASVDLRVNLLRGSRAQAQAQLAAEGIEAEPTAHAATGLRLKQRAPLQRLASFRAGLYEPQDEGSQRLACELAPRPGERIADFCAGAGGKTLAIGALMQDRGELHAFDTSAARLARLAPRLQRSGLSMVRTHALTSSGAAPAALAETFDAVLVDAPCSGSGTLRRHPELRLREPDLDALQALQLGILERAAALVRPGGRLLYATCSVLREENEAVTAAFLHRHAQFSAGPELRLLPHRDGCDGYFAVTLTRGGLTLRRAASPRSPGARR